MKKEIRVFLEDIKESADRIEEYSQGMSKTHFMEDIRTQDAIIRRLEIVEEAVKNIPEDFKSKYPNIPWKQIAGMRDVLIHGYFGVNLERVWAVVERDLPELKPKVLRILEEAE
jgi:uncharacterized protein with HEPN domain